LGPGAACYNARHEAAALIETTDLTKQFGDLTAVQGVTLNVEAGEVLALLGPNGAGKTTTIRMLASILTPTRGTARVAGFDARRQPALVRARVGLLTEHHGLYTRMRALEYLVFFGRIYALSAAQAEARARSLLDRFQLMEFAGRRLGEFSKGTRQKLALVRSLIHDPPVLLLDEPTSAMDPASARLVRESIAALRSRERAIIVCTHNLTEAEALADRIAIIRGGSIAALGTPEELKRKHLGDPIIELRLARPLDGALSLLPPDVVPLSAGDAWLRYRTDQPETVNPRVLRALASGDVPVVSLSEVGRTLEEVYIRVVGSDEGLGPGRT
jgi:ABC-2 type transport system ATP-binding protein